MNARETYALAVGKSDEERLNIQCRICDPYTKRFRTENLPNLKGKTILDIGCGTGILSCYWADEVGPTGKVIAIDISGEQLDIARKNAAERGLNNIEFIEMNVQDINTLYDKFDLIYCRFVLMHLKDQEMILRKLYDQIKPDGYLFCEEAMSYDAFFADPDSEAFQAWKKLILKLPLIYGTNFFVGKRLHSLFSNIGIHIVKSEICQPIICEEQDKGYYYLAFTESVKKKIVDKGMATMEEIEKVLENLKAEMLLKPWVSTTVQQMQIVGRK